MESQIPNSLRYYRKRAGLTQEEVAQILGLGKRGADSVLQWEKGYRLPNITNWFKLAALYHVKPEHIYKWLFKNIKNDYAEKVQLLKRLKCDR